MSNSGNIPDILPEDYDINQLCNYVRTRLGGSVWRLEGLGTDGGRATIMAAVSDAVRAYSRRVPLQRFEILRTSANKTTYALKSKSIYGVARVDFIGRNLTVSPLLSSLVGVSPIMNLEGRDLNAFLTWRKSFARQAGIDPKWVWNEETKLLHIHNPMANNNAGVLVFCSRDFDHVKMVHKEWISRYVVAACKETLGIARRKFGGQLPGPGGTSLNLDGDKMVDEAKAEIEVLRKELVGFQTKIVPMFD